MLEIILIILLVLLPCGCGAWGYRGGPYVAPAGIVGVILLILLVILLLRVL